MFLHIVPYYAAALAVIYVALAAHVIIGRWNFRIAFGTAGNEAMLKRTRAHGNFAEYVPFGLLLLAFAEMRGASPDWIQGLCILLVVARLAHVVGIYRPVPNLFRAAGMIGTFTVLLVAAGLIAFQ